MAPSLAEATYSHEWSYAHPSNRSKTSAAFSKSFCNQELESPGPGHYDVPLTFGKQKQPHKQTTFPLRQDRCIQLSGVTGSIGPGSYQPIYDGFDRFLRDASFPRYKPVPRVPSVRYVSTAPRLARVEHRVGGPDSTDSPGPGSYDIAGLGEHRRYSAGLAICKRVSSLFPYTHCC